MMTVGITGQKRSGKDTAAKRMIEKWGYTRIGLPDPLNEELVIINPWCEITDRNARMWLPRFVRFAELVELVGIDRAKDISADVRAYQQRYGTDVVRDRIDVDRWVALARDRMSELRRGENESRFVLPNVRAENETQLCDILVRIVRPGFEIAGSDHSIEQGIDSLTVAYTIVNDGTRADLCEKVDEIMYQFHAVKVTVPPTDAY